MKKIKIFIMFLTLLCVGVLSPRTSFAQKPAPMKSKDITQSKNLVIKYLQSPDFKLAGKEIDGKITATFRVGEDGKIEVDKVSAPSPRLETYVTEKLSAIAATYDYKEVIHPYDQNFEVLIRFN